MRRLLLAPLLLLCVAAARGDGGRLLLRDSAGPFLVSLFSVPESVAVGDADLSVMVEEPGTGELLLDPTVVLSLTPPAGGAPIRIRMSPAAAGDRTLQQATVHLSRAGAWQGTLAISQGGRQGRLGFELAVANHSARRGTVLTFALLPLVVLLLFAWQQRARARLRRPRRGRDLADREPLRRGERVS